MDVLPLLDFVAIKNIAPPLPPPPKAFLSSHFKTLDNDYFTLSKNLPTGISVVFFLKLIC